MNMTTTNYVHNVMAQVKHLTPPIEERDLVYIYKLARHFSEPVSYTHLDVYKRQLHYLRTGGGVVVVLMIIKESLEKHQYKYVHRSDSKGDRKHFALTEFKNYPIIKI